MSRKMIAMILAGIVSVLLVTGCSSQNEGQEVSNAGTTQQQTTEQAQPEEEVTILPSEARIGIAYVQGEGEFTSSFLVKVRGNLVSAGVPEENIESVEGTAQELAGIASKMIADGCSALMVGNVDENSAPAITEAAAQAGIPLVYFGTSPGQTEISGWSEKGWKVVYIGSRADQAASKRADLISAADLEKIDLNEDGEIGMAVLYTGKDSAGDAVNRDTIRILQEQEVPIYDLTEENDSEDGDGEEVYEGTDREMAAEQVSSWMSEYGKSLELILCADDEQAMGAWDAVSREKRKVGHDVMIMGFEAGTDSLAEVAAGNIRSTFFNDFMEQSQNASAAVLAFLKGSRTEGENVVMSDYVSVTVDNAQEILDIAGKIRESIPEPQEDSEDTDNTENEAEE